MGVYLGGQGYRWVCIWVGRDIDGCGFALGRNTDGCGFGWAGI